jgi:hypothetical protein
MFFDLVASCSSSINGVLRIYESLDGVIDNARFHDCFDIDYGHEFVLHEVCLEIGGFGDFVPGTVTFYDSDGDFGHCEVEVDVEVFVFPPRSWDGFLAFLSGVSNSGYSVDELREESEILFDRYPFRADEYFLSFVNRCEQVQSMVVSKMSESLDFAYRFATEPTGTILDKFDRLLVVFPDGRIEGFHGAFISASVNQSLHLDKDIGRELDRSYYFLVPECFFDGRDYRYGFRPFMKDFYRKGYLGKFERDVYEEFLRDMPEILDRMNRADSEDDNDSWLRGIYGLDYSLDFDGVLSRWFLNCYILTPKESDLIRALVLWKSTSRRSVDTAVEVWTLPFPAFEDQGWRPHLEHYKLRIAGQQSLF